MVEVSVDSCNKLPLSFYYHINLVPSDWSNQITNHVVWHCGGWGGGGGGVQIPARAIKLHNAYHYTKFPLPLKVSYYIRCIGDTLLASSFLPYRLTQGMCLHEFSSLVIGQNWIILQAKFLGNLPPF